MDDLDGGPRMIIVIAVVLLGFLLKELLYG